MKGDPKIIQILNDVLTAELTAISQYFVHAEMCDNWGYHRLHRIIRKHSIGEMKHAEELIERILFLEGIPNVQRLGKINIGENVPEMLKVDYALEIDALPRLNQGIETCGDIWATTTPAISWRRSWRRRKSTSTGSKRRWRSSNRSAFRTTSPSRSRRERSRAPPPTAVRRDGALPAGGTPAVPHAGVFSFSTSSFTASADFCSAAASSASSLISMTCSRPLRPSFTGTPTNRSRKPYSP